MGSWYNELEYIKKSGVEDSHSVKFRLVFRLRYPFELVQQFLKRVEDSLGESGGRRVSVYEPDMTIDMKTSGFSQIFGEKSVRNISKTLNASREATPEPQQLAPNMVVLLYYEALYSFLKLRFALYPVDFIQLLALKLRVDFGAFKESKEDYISTNFKAICPLLDARLESKKQSLYQSVMGVYRELRVTALEAMKKFLFICGKFPNFFQELFPIRLFERDDQKLSNFFQIPRKCYIAVGLGGVGVYGLDFERRNQFSFKDLLKWGFSEKLFILIIEDPDQELPIKISFKTRMASNIVYSLNSVCNLKRGKLPEENQLQMNRNVTREITENKFFKRASKFKVNHFFFE